MKPLLASFLVLAGAFVIGAYALHDNESIADGGRLLAEAGSAYVTANSEAAGTTGASSAVTNTGTQQQTTVVHTETTNPGTILPVVTKPVSTTSPRVIRPAATIVQPNDAAPRILKEAQPAQTTNVAPVQNKPAVAEPRAQIEGVGSSLRTLQQEVRTVDNSVRNTVIKDVEEARAKAATESTGTAPTAFDADERSRRINLITEKLSQDVHATIAGGDVPQEKIRDLEPVLKSSLKEIQLLIKDETGVDVDLSPSARAVTDVVEARSPELQKAREEVLKRKGLDLYRDTDEDGISDYDEKHIYGTDPERAATAGGSLTDGERILLGFNPLSTSTERVPVESPRVAGDVAENVFEVHTISVDLEPITASSSEDTPPLFKETMTFTGRALPNSFVTLYVFSTPVVVTVKADASGAWSYKLDTELEDGAHELYVATVDAGGRILAKSPAVPFVKTAQAAEFAPLLIASADEPTLTDFLLENLWLVGVIAFLLFGVIALVILGLMRAGPGAPTAA